MFNIRQQKYYFLTDKLKCHSLYSKYLAFSLINTSVIRMSHPWHSVAVTLSCISLWRSNLIWFMNENLFIFSHHLKFHQMIHDSTASVHQQVLTKKISWASGVLRAVNSL